MSTIKVTLETSCAVTQKGSTKLTITATGTGMPSAIFAIEVLPISADAGTAQYRFSHVCSPAELLELPDHETTENTFFRIPEVEFLFDTIYPVESVVATVKGDVERLVHEIRQLDALPPAASSIIDIE